MAAHGWQSETMERMVEMNNQQKPQMKQILSQLGIQENSVLACWLVGSRLWGTARSESDWDFVFVLKDPNSNRGKKDKGKVPGKDKWAIHKNQYDAICYTATGFKEALTDHTFQSVLVAFLLPDSFRFIEKNLQSLGAFPPSSLKINTFCDTVEKEAERDVGVAAKKAGKGLVVEARKVFCHCFRMLLVSLQVVDHLSSPSSSSLKNLDLWGDLKEGEEEEEEGERRDEEEWGVYGMLKVEYSTDWGYLEGLYGPPLEKLRGKLKNSKTN